MVVLAAACDQPLPSSPADAAPDALLHVRAAHAGMPDLTDSAPEPFPYPGPESVPVSAGEWPNVEGSAHFRCVDGGTEVHVRLRGLIGGGLYTVWNLLFAEDGTRTGIGSLGPADGSGNVMLASADGSAALTTLVPEGALSMSGAAGACLPREVALIQLIVAYHTDGRAYGPVPGPAGTVVNHVRFAIRRELPRRSATESIVLPFPGELVSPMTQVQWESARARATVACTDQGTTVSMGFRGLVPGGVYTVWHLLFDDGGNRIGIGALGAEDGSENGFIASASGSGTLTAVVPAGALSISGAAGSCLLIDEAEFHFAAAYHVDGLDHGPVPGPAGTVFTQVGVAFVN